MRPYGAFCGAVGGVIGVGALLVSLACLAVLAVLCVFFPPLILLLGLGVWLCVRSYRNDRALQHQRYLRTLPPPPNPHWQPVPTCPPPKWDPRPDSLSD